MKKYVFKYEYYSGLRGDKDWQERTKEFPAETEQEAVALANEIWKGIKTKAPNVHGAQKHDDAYRFISLTEVQTRVISIQLDYIIC